MSISIKILLFLVSALCLVLVFSLLLFSMVATMSDAQGILVIIFTGPIVLGITALNLWLLRKNERVPGRSFLKGFSVGLPTLFVALMLLGFVPGLNRITWASFELVNKGFVAYFGKDPKTYFRERNDLGLAIRKELQKSQGLTLDFSLIKLRYEWDRVCIFTPYTDEKEADAIMGFPTHLDMYSELKSSDSIHLIVFYEGKAMTAYTKLGRDTADFQLQRSACFEKDHSRFVRSSLGSPFALGI
jgi:hypothetical protein